MVIRIIQILTLMALSLKLSGKELKFKFYSDNLIFTYNEDLLIRHSLRPTDQNIKEFYIKLEGTSYQDFIREAVAYKNKVKLNDWFYYRLLWTAIQELFKDKDHNFKVAFCWFLLNKSGYNSNIRFVGGKMFALYVYSKSDVLMVSYNFNRKHYVALEKSNIKEPSVRQLGFVPNENGIPFSFELENLPELSISEKERRHIVYQTHNGSESIDVDINKSGIMMLENYPQMQSKNYFKINLSSEARETLIPFLKDKIKGMTDSAAVRYLLTFVRMGFKYEDDMLSFGQEKYMVAEEVLYYSTADCEDKSALFFYLIKEILNLEELVLRYPKHINVAVLLNKPYGRPILYNGKQYSICETNILGDSKKAGIGYNTETSKPNIIYEYQPNEE